MHDTDPYREEDAPTSVEFSGHKAAPVIAAGKAPVTRSRREFLTEAATAGVGMTLAAIPNGAAAEPLEETTESVDAASAGEIPITLTINGKTIPMVVEPRVT